jgi:hypothetical protein
VFSDDFESGDLSRWTSVTGLAVQQQETYSGAWAARQTSTSAATYAYKQLATGENDVYYRLRFKVLSQGQNNVTLGKFLTAGGSSILAFYRSSSGALGLRNDVLGATTSSTTIPTAGTWHELLVHLRLDGGGQTEVWLDGDPVDALRTTQSLGSTPIGRVQLGNNQTGRTYDVAMDDVAVSRGESGYPRPRSATPMGVRLVPAFAQCTAPNSMHGAPLALGSCSPAVPSSNYLTVGTPDTNGEAANSSGEVLFRVVGESPIDPTNGDQADVRITAELRDVRRKSDLTDYGGELQLIGMLRISDRYNGPALDEPGTVTDLPLSVTIRCTPVPDAAVGATCNASTTADAVSAGTVREGRRAVWQLGRVEVYDGGSDGVAATEPNTLFEHQGLFAP